MKVELPLVRLGWCLASLHSRLAAQLQPLGSIPAPLRKEMEENTTKTPKLLPMLVVGWALVWILVSLLSGDWFPGLFWLATWIGILAMLAGVVLLVPSTVVAIVSLFRWLSKKGRPDVVAFLPLVIMLVIYFLGSEMPSRTAMTFYLHRDDFIGLVDSSVSEFQNTDATELRLPESPLYEWASVYRDFSSNELVVEFIVGDFYLPLVYISTDNPYDVLDTCSRGGIPIEKLELKWYVCRRDWN